MLWLPTAGESSGGWVRTIVILAKPVLGSTATPPPPGFSSVPPPSKNFIVPAKPGNGAPTQALVGAPGPLTCVAQTWPVRVNCVPYCTPVPGMPVSTVFVGAALMVSGANG